MSLNDRDIDNILDFSLWEALKSPQSEPEINGDKHDLCSPSPISGEVEMSEWGNTLFDIDVQEIPRPVL